eukprot:TRINITY_DN1409_c1_g2_i1.p1 TRINITY_DN1409_c1_g2~~TRINITY_DN1409_c1_g2_i1.p1  ORF type:complete len:336 (-),score=47.63 TRINITY_DN1409_c1_g2_i1:188-1195(-)
MKERRSRSSASNSKDSPFIALKSVIDNSANQSSPFLIALYNTLGIFFLFILISSVILLYYLFNPFLKPLLWAALLSIFLAPIKSKLIYILQSFFQKVVHNKQPLIVGIILIPWDILNWIETKFRQNKLSALFFVITITINMIWHLLEVDQQDHIRNKLYSASNFLLFELIFYFFPFLSTVQQTLSFLWHNFFYFVYIPLVLLSLSGAYYLYSKHNLTPKQIIDQYLYVVIALLLPAVAHPVIYYIGIHVFIIILFGFLIMLLIGIFFPTNQTDLCQLIDADILLAQQQQQEKKILFRSTKKHSSHHHHHHHNNNNNNTTITPNTTPTKRCSKLKK